MMKPLDSGRKNIYSTNNMRDETKTISQKEIINFVFGQPRERRVEMGEFRSNSQCGCVMVQYGKEILGLKEYFSCGSGSIGGEYSIDGPHGIFTLLGIGSNSYSYGEIQDILTARIKDAASVLEQNTNNMKNTVNTLHSAGFRVNVHHLRFPKRKTRKTKPMNINQFAYTDEIAPKGGKTIVVVMKDGKLEFGESYCNDMDHYCKADGVNRAAARALEKFNA